MRLLLRLLHEAYLAWVLDGKKLRSPNIEGGSYYSVRDGFVMWVCDDLDGDESWAEHSGMMPSDVIRQVKHGYLGFIN